MQSKVLLIHALSPVHAGTGQSIGAVDLPIARNRATEHPYIPGSSIKGSLRDIAQDKWHRDLNKVHSLFGPEATESSDASGTVAIGDANIVALPVRSISGTFAWICSPYTLTRFVRDLKDGGVDIDLPDLSLELENCKLHSKNHLSLNIDGQRKVVFEDLDMGCTYNPSVDAFIASLAKVLFQGDEAWQNLFVKKCCIVSDDIFTFLAKNGTDVVTRIRISHESKTVVDGALWTEENLPAESVLYANIVSMPNRKRDMNDATILSNLSQLMTGPVQLGGKATIGRGRCKLAFVGGVQ